MPTGDGCCHLGTSWQGQEVAAGTTMVQAISTGLALKQALLRCEVVQGTPGPSPILPQQQEGTHRAQPHHTATALGCIPTAQAVRHTRHQLSVSLALNFPTSSEVFKHAKLS